MADLPLASSPNLVLAHPTPAEKLKTWTLNAKNWGSALSLPDYLEREKYLANIPQTRDGGVTRTYFPSVLPLHTFSPRPLPLFSAIFSVTYLFHRLDPYRLDPP